MQLEINVLNDKYSHLLFRNKMQLEINVLNDSNDKNTRAISFIRI
jgi:hypothetical protein